MARLQILELPEGASNNRPPFLLVIDKVDDQTAADIARWPDDIATRIGAGHVLCFSDAIEIPANEIPVGPDGYPLTVRVEGDFDQFRQQVQEEAVATSRVLAGARYVARQYRDQPKRAYGEGGQVTNLCCRYCGAPSSELVTNDGGDLHTCTRCAEWRAKLNQRKDALADALGMDPLRDWDDIANAARGLRKARGLFYDRLQAVTQLHQRVEHRKQMICGHCSAWDGPEYDSTDNPPIGWPCDTIKAATGYTGEDAPTVYQELQSP